MSGWYDCVSDCYIGLQNPATKATSKFRGVKSLPTYAMFATKLLTEKNRVRIVKTTSSLPGVVDFMVLIYAHVITRVNVSNPFQTTMELMRVRTSCMTQMSMVLKNKVVMSWLMEKRW